MLHQNPTGIHILLYRLSHFLHLCILNPSDILEQCSCRCRIFI